MSYLKSVYISLLLTAAAVGLAVSISRMVTEGIGSPWSGTAVACGAFVTFIGFAYLLPRPLTSRNLYGMLIAGMLGALLAGWLERGFGPATMTAIAVGVLGNLIYVFWYSRFSSHNGELAEGRALPQMRLLEHGKPILSKELIRRPALWIFYRGNWCPLCVAQVREVADQYTELARRGVDVFLVSPQSPKKTEALAKRGAGETVNRTRAVRAVQNECVGQEALDRTRVDIRLVGNLAPLAQTAPISNQQT